MRLSPWLQTTDIPVRQLAACQLFGGRPELMGKWGRGKRPTTDQHGKQIFSQKCEDAHSLRLPWSFHLVLKVALLGFHMEFLKFTSLNSLWTK